MILHDDFSGSNIIFKLKVQEISVPNFSSEASLTVEFLDHKFVICCFNYCIIKDIGIDFVRVYVDFV